MLPKKTGVAVGTFLFVMVASAFIATQSWDGKVFFFLSGDKRNPAAIKGVFDFSNLEGSALKLASHQRLLANAKLVKNETAVGIELGHFVVKNNNGEREMACNTYNRVKMVFTAEGVAENGVSPAMVVTGPCNIGKDVSRILPLWIPMTKILQAQPKDQSFVVNEIVDSKIQFSNVGSAWPQSWTLVKVEIFNGGNPSQNLVMEGQEIAKHHGKAITFNW